MRRLIDTHCHLDFDNLAKRIDHWLSVCEERGIESLVLPSVTERRAESVMAIGHQYPQVSVALGLHPYFTDEHLPEHLDRLEVRISQNRGAVIAVGEIGLDKSVGNMDAQTHYFSRQLLLAKKFDLPVIIHSFKTHSEVLGLLRRYEIKSGVIHAYSGSEQDAMKFIDQGLFIGVGAVITWPGSKKTRSTISNLPIERLVLETDAPDMPVQGQKKGDGTPLNLLDVFSELSALRSESQDTLAKALYRNTFELFSRLRDE